MFRKLYETESEAVTVIIDGVSVVAELGETVAAVLLRQEEPWSRLTPVTRSKRSPYCMMGVCFECLAKVDGVDSIQTCLRAVCDRMRIERQTEKRRISPLTA